MVQGGVVAREGAEPQESAKAPSINDQVQWSFEFQHKLTEAFQGEQLQPALRMAALTEAIELTLLAVTQAFGAATEMGLFQRFSNQAPAERTPTDRPGMRVR
jgi:hypothetical protein